MRALRRLLAMVSLPYFRLELPGWRRLSSLVGLPIGNEALWADASPRLMRGKLHGMRMKLHMQDWCERLTYFLGRYYEFGTELALTALIERGETFVDVGGNVGMTMLMGAACVGPQGIVHVFEPNPEMASRIRGAVNLNGLANVTVHPIGLSDAQEDLLLTTVSQSSGWATFGEVAKRDSALTYGTIPAKVMRADDVLGNLAGVVTMKIDVEGFEYRVLKGMERLIQGLRPAIITEVDHRLLAAAGSSARELFALMAAHGYRGYEMDAEERIGSGPLRLRAADNDLSAARNVLWVHPMTVHHQRIQPYLASEGRSACP